MRRVGRLFRFVEQVELAGHGFFTAGAIAFMQQQIDVFLKREKLALDLLVFNRQAVFFGG